MYMDIRAVKKCNEFVYDFVNTTGNRILMFRDFKKRV